MLEALRAHPDQIDRLYVVEGQVPASHAAELLSLRTTFTDWPALVTAPR